MVKPLRDNCGGIAIALLWSAIFFIVILVSVFMIDVYYTNVKAEIAKDAATMAAMSVYRGLDRGQLETGEIIVNDQMVGVFKSYLAKNMKLNEDLTAKSGSIAVGQVIVEDFKVYRKSDLSQTYPDGSTVRYKPSVYVKVRFDIEPVLKGVVGRKSVSTSAVADIISHNN